MLSRYNCVFAASVKVSPSKVAPSVCDDEDANRPDMSSRTGRQGSVTVSACSSVSSVPPSPPSPREVMSPSMASLRYSPQLTSSASFVSGAAPLLRQSPSRDLLGLKRQASAKGSSMGLHTGPRSGFFGQYEGHGQVHA